MGWDRKAVFGTTPTRCLRMRRKEDEKEQALLPSSLPKSPFLGTALSSWQGSEGGPDEEKAEGGASEQEQCEKRGEGKWGYGQRKKGWGRRRAELTHRHVGARSNKGVGHGIYELAAHSKIAQLDLPTRVDQDVGGLDIYVTEKVNK